MTDLFQPDTDERSADMVESVELRVENLDCEHDAAAIERGLRDSAGLLDLKVYAKAAKVVLRYDVTVTSPELLTGQLAQLGFPAQQGRVAKAQPKPWRNAKVLTSAASGLLLLVGWLLSLAGVPSVGSNALYLAAILIGGYYFGREAIEEVLFEREVGIELLMSVAAVVATLMGQAVEGAMLVFLYSISEAAEGYTEEKTRGAITALMDLTPKVALVRRDGQETEIPVEELVVGDRFIVRPGEAVATDGAVRAGTSSVNQAPVTGESVPVEKRQDDMVFAGSINGEGALEIEATTTFANNTIARIIHMVEEAQEQKGKSQRFIERFGTRYSPAVLLIGILVALVPPLVSGSFSSEWSTWLTRATVFIVAAAPCALVISIPITLVASLGTAARHGVLVKGGVYVEQLATITVVALDKTGTVTQGVPEVTDVLPIHQGKHDAPASPGDVLALAAGIERYSQHPLGQAIVRSATVQGVAPRDVTEFRSLTGAGASGRVDGTPVYIGSPDLFIDSFGARFEEQVQQQIEGLRATGKTVVVLGDEQRLLGLLGILDTVRPGVREAIRGLHEGGVRKVVMLTGDNERTARAIADRAGIDEVYADLKPEDKVAIVRRLTKQHGHVAMVGDGVNDAPALAEATVGVAMGAAGTDVALETADVALMADDLGKLVYALRLARRNQSVVRQNLGLSVVVIGTLVVGAVIGAFSLPIAVLGHEVSEFIVIGSGLRMVRS